MELPEWPRGPRGHAEKSLVGWWGSIHSVLSWWGSYSVQLFVLLCVKLADYFRGLCGTFFLHLEQQHFVEVTGECYPGCYLCTPTLTESGFVMDSYKLWYFLYWQ